MSVSSLPHVGDPAVEQDQVFLSGCFTLHDRISPVTYTCVDDDILYLHADNKDFAVRVLCYLTTRPKPWTLTEGAIAAQFGVDIQRVKRAMKWLTDEGYVKSRRRKVSYGIFTPAGRVERNIYVWDWNVYKVPRMNPDWVRRHRA